MRVPGCPQVVVPERELVCTVTNPPEDDDELLVPELLRKPEYER